MSNDYRIAKERYQVVVTTLEGEELVGDMFVQPYSPRHTGPEAPGDVLNDGDPFFPLALEDGDTLLLAKTGVRDVVVPHDGDAVAEEDYAVVGMRMALVELTLTGGGTCTGSLRLEMPDERPRLLDFLNRFHERFLPLHTEAGMRLVSWRCIERVRPLD